MSDHFVIDPSVLIQAYVHEPNTDNVLALLNGLKEPASVSLHAPEFCLMECTNILWRHARFHGMPAATATKAINDLINLPLNRPARPESGARRPRGPASPPPEPTGGRHVSKWRAHLGCLLLQCAYGSEWKVSLRLMNEPLITTSADILSGTPVFTGTRVPVRHLIDYLASGETIEAFLEDFPTVQREQVLRFLKSAEYLVVHHADQNLD